MFRIIITIVLSFGACWAEAQTTGDALRYSYWQYGGTARYVGAGGALGALGGDYSAIINNPASIAAFRRSEFTVTSGLRFGDTETTVQQTGDAYEDSRITANLNQMGVVFTGSDGGDWETINLAFGYNRLADFNQKFNFISNTQGSITDYLLPLANGLTPEQLGDFDTGLAFDTELLYQSEDFGNTSYFADILPGQKASKFQTVQSKGSMGELNLSVGGNYKHRWYVGGGIGIPVLEFSQRKVYEERDADNSIEVFNHTIFREHLNTEGVGFNINLGAIYRVNQAFRIGAAFHSPTWLFLSESFSNAMETSLDLPGQTSTQIKESESPEGLFEYTQRSPMRLSLSLGAIINKKGFISAEAGWVDYRRNLYNFNDGDVTSADLEYERELNTSIEDIFQSVFNIKLGGEYVLGEHFRVRAGYCLYGNPYDDSNGAFGTRQFSGGLGYRMDDFFIDLSYSHRTGSEYYRPYAAVNNNTPLINNELTTSEVLLTFGVKIGRMRCRVPW